MGKSLYCWVGSSSSKLNKNQTNKTGWPLEGMRQLVPMSNMKETSLLGASQFFEVEKTRPTKLAPHKDLFISLILYFVPARKFNQTSTPKHEVMRGQNT